MTHLFLVASARANGNSERLAQIASETLPQKTQCEWLALRDYPLEPFADIRHAAEEEYGPVEGHAETLVQATLRATHLVFVTPVYWYSVPAALKLYLDHWSHWMRIEGLNFRERMHGKTCWAISCSAGAADEAQAMFTTLRLSAQYLSMDWGGEVLGNGSAPGDVLNDERAVASAKQLFTGSS